ncbi:methyltransferase domain-containing protein [Desulfovibrio sp.]|uniref:class I SAM-dependent methyltransferase n=1 Tax=Desulfovibrio sp. TaxID=885 RepID=UPI0023D3E8A2|nr:methyltransferase domain-containing protein [Desulfovibrio sp.]MDE7240455.1 class I SAM-dependent methyltransferase [Desulfovibrio sp.]
MKRGPEGRERPGDVATARFVLAAQLRLLERALAAWPRRDAALLDVNCGSGVFLPFLWACGFEVDGVEANAAARGRAQTRCPTATVMAGSDDALPVEDDAYDWVLLHLQEPRRLAAALAEARRVARRGLAVTFWNRHSLAGVCARLARAPLPAKASSWLEVARALRRMDKASAPGQTASLSVLAGPVRTWRAASPFSRCNRWPMALPLGAWGVFRCSLEPSGGVTPLALRLGDRFGRRMDERLSAPEPVLECGRKPLSSCLPGGGDEGGASLCPQFCPASRPRPERTSS